MKLIKKWSFSYGESILGVKLIPMTKEQDQNFFAITKSGKLLLFTEKGKLLLNEKITNNTPIWNFHISDINNDGIIELILGGLDGVLRIFQYTSRSVLKLLWTHQFGSSISGIRIENICNNENYEILAYSLDKSIRVLRSYEGNLIWGQLFEDGIEDAKIWIDTQNNNRKKILACGNDGTIRIFDALNGDLLWFKRFSNKVRFINYINSKKGILIVCGGDDKQLHFIDNQSHNEIASLEFDDYVWKCISFPSLVNNAILVSSYSFDYLEQSKPLQNIIFTSKLLYIDQNLETIWELPNKNVEVIHRFQAETHRLIAIGTTQGEFLILDEKSGTIKYSINHNSCVNAIQYEPISKTFIICYEDGLINALHITNN